MFVGMFTQNFKEKTMKNKPEANENDCLWGRKVTGLEDTFFKIRHCDHVNVLHNYKTKLNQNKKTSTQK